MLDNTQTQDARSLGQRALTLLAAAAIPFSGPVACQSLSEGKEHSLMTTGIVKERRFVLNDEQLKEFRENQKKNHGNTLASQMESLQPRYENASTDSCVCVGHGMWIVTIKDLHAQRFAEKLTVYSKPPMDYIVHLAGVLAQGGFDVWAAKSIRPTQISNVLSATSSSEANVWNTLTQQQQQQVINNFANCPKPNTGSGTGQPPRGATTQVVTDKHTYIASTLSSGHQVFTLSDVSFSKLS